MLEQNNPQEKSILNNPEIAREEMALKPEPAKRTNADLIVKIILILLIIVLLLYLFTNPQVIQNFVNKFFSKLLK